MLAENTFSVRWWRAVRERRETAKVLLWWPLAALAGLLVIALLFDEPVSHALQGWPEHERVFFRWFTDFGKSDWILIPALLAWIVSGLAGYAPLTYRWEWARRGVLTISSYLFITVGLAGLVTAILKRLIGRARPMYLDELGTLHFQPFDILDWSMHSFPSGHATTAVAFAFAVRSFTNRRYRGWIIAFGFGIGLSRIVVGDHFLSDVIAGSLVGLVIAILVRDYFVTRGWGMRIEGGKARFRMFKAFVPLWRKLRRGQVPALLK